METDSFDSLFQEARIHRGAEYVQARDAILALQSQADVAPKLTATTRGDRPWEERLTAEILLGWMHDRDVFERCSDYVRKPLPGPPPAAGFTSAVRGKAIASFGRAVTPRLLEMLWKTKEFADEKELGTLFTALIYLHDDRAVLPLRAMVEETGHPAVARGAIRALAALGDARGLDVLLRIVAGDGDGSLRHAVIEGLAGFVDPRAAATLLEILGDASHPLDERRIAARALYRQGDPVVRTAVRDVLMRERDKEISMLLVLLLGRVGTEADVPLLESLSTSAEMKEAVADALAMLNSRGVTR